MTLSDELLRDIRAFMAAHDMSPTAFGIAAVNDGHFVRDLEAGTDIRASRVDRVRQFMRDYRPRPNKRAAYQPAA